MNNIFNKLTFSRLFLIEKLKEHRLRFLNNIPNARNKYFNAINSQIAVLQEIANKKDVSNMKPIRINFEPPRIDVDEYDRYILLLESSTDETIVLNQREAEMVLSGDFEVEMFNKMVMQSYQV